MDPEHINLVAFRTQSKRNFTKVVKFINKLLTKEGETEKFIVSELKRKLKSFEEFHKLIEETQNKISTYLEDDEEDSLSYQETGEYLQKKSETANLAVD